MKFQILFLRNIRKKNVAKLSSVELVQRVVKVKEISTFVVINKQCDCRSSSII